MKKCYQRINIYGLRMPDECKPACPLHLTDGEQPGTECIAFPQRCYHHYPLYDEFIAWVEEVRHETGTTSLPNV